MKYEIKITFETDRELTPAEQFAIGEACQVQVEEPVDEGDPVGSRKRWRGRCRSIEVMKPRITDATNT